MAEEISSGVAREILDRDVAHLAIQKLGLDGANPNGLAGDYVFLRFRPSLAHNPHNHLATCFAAQQIDRLVQRHVDRALVIDAHDLIHGLQAQSGRGGVRQGRDDGQHAPANRNADAEATEFTRGLQLHLTVKLGRQQI